MNAPESVVVPMPAGMPSLRLIFYIIEMEGFFNPLSL
jgi:hypothetical protein